MLVEIEARESARILRMNHAPENRFNQEFVAALNQALDVLEAEEGAKAVIVTSAIEKYFSNGLDLTWMLTQTREALTPFLLDFNRFLHRVLVYPKPIVAAMNGHAFAGGLFLACTADWRVMREDRGWCCLPEIDVGIDLTPGSVALVAHLIGHRNTDYLNLTGRRIAGPEALALGLVDELAAQDEVMPRAIAIAQELGKKSLRQYTRHKRMLRAGVARIMTGEDEAFIRGQVETAKAP